MKRYLMTILAAVMATIGAKAMPYEMAREEAMYLTDKMAYELNLNQRQYEYAYEINLDYLMSLNRPEDAYGMQLRFRNEDLFSILYEWQWNILKDVEYFMHPVSWRYGRWFYPVYGYYSRNYYYYTRPAVYHNYKGLLHSRLHHNGGYYADRRPRWEEGFRGADRGHAQPNRPGMNQGFNGRPGMNQGFNNRPGMNQNNRPDMNQNNRPNNNQNGRVEFNQNNRNNNTTVNRGNTTNVNRNTNTNVNRGNTNVNRGNVTTSRGNSNVTAGRSNTSRTTTNRSNSNVSAGRGHATGGRGGR